MDTPFPDITDELPPILRQTVAAQTRLGWDQLYHSRLSSLWATAVEQLNPHLHLPGRAVILPMLKAVWNYILDLWKIQNQHLHNNGGKMSQPNYQQAVRTMYEQKSQLPIAIQEALFHRPLDQMLDQTPAFLRTWIERSQRYIKQQMKAANKQATLKTHDIRSFFRRPTSSANDLEPP